MIKFLYLTHLRFNLIAKLAGIKEVYQYPLFKKNKQHITETAKSFLRNSINIKDFNDPNIEIEENHSDQIISKFNLNKNNINILLGIGGSGPTKRIPAKIFIKFAEKIIKNKNCKFF